jgi:hypothetical protein
MKKIMIVITAEEANCRKESFNMLPVLELASKDIHIRENQHKILSASLVSLFNHC